MLSLAVVAATTQGPLSPSFLLPLRTTDWGLGLESFGMISQPSLNLHLLISFICHHHHSGHQETSTEQGPGGGGRERKKCWQQGPQSQPAVAGKEHEEEDPNQAERRAGPLDLGEGDQGSPGGARPLRGLRSSEEL